MTCREINQISKAGEPLPRTIGVFVSEGCCQVRLHGQDLMLQLFLHAYHRPRPTHPTAMRSSIELPGRCAGLASPHWLCRWRISQGMSDNEAHRDHRRARAGTPLTVVLVRRAMLGPGPRKERPSLSPDARRLHQLQRRHAPDDTTIHSIASTLAWMPAPGGAAVGLTALGCSENTLTLLDDGAPAGVVEVVQTASNCCEEICEG